MVVWIQVWLVVVREIIVRDRCCYYPVYGQRRGRSGKSTEQGVCPTRGRDKTICSHDEAAIGV